MSQEPTAQGGTTTAPELLEPMPGSKPQPPVFNECDRIVILTPCYDRQSTTDYQESLALCKQYPTARFKCADGQVRVLPIVAASLWVSNDSHIDRARNSILWSFEQTHYRFGLWMDGDQPFEPEHIASLWRHLMNGVQVVTGLVALKSIVPTFVCNTIAGERPDPQTGLLKIKDGGTGCMAFNRSVLEAMRKAWPEIAYKSNANTVAAGKTVYAYFASGVIQRDGAGDWLSEDWMFCHRCKLLGIPVYADTNVKIKHIGRMSFPPDPTEIIEAAAVVTSGHNPPFPKHLAASMRDLAREILKEVRDSSISVLHATRRPFQALDKMRLWEANASDKKFEYIFAVDEDDETSREALKNFRHVVVPNKGGIVAPINYAAISATGKILVMAADDCTPPEGWDAAIRKALEGQYHEPRVLMTSDGYSRQMLIPHPIMTRAFYQAQGGYFFCPEYAHLFCDTELTVRAFANDQVIDGRHIVFKHDHPMFTGAKPDELHEQRNSPEAWAEGQATFKRRNPNSGHPHAK